MLVNYKNSANKNGIYKIENTINNRIYIGSTIRFKKRFPSHVNRLINGNHTNTFLQNDFNKCGEEAFVFEVIEVVDDPTILLIREQFYLDQYYDNQKQCYNLRPDACDSRAGSKNKLAADPLTDKRFQTPSEETILKRSEAIKQAYENDPELRERRSQITKNTMWKDHSANVTLVHKDTKEEVLIDTSLRQFALDRNLSYKSLHLLTRGKTKSCGGWYLKENGEPIYISQKGEKRKPLSDEHRAKISKGKYFGMKLIHTETNEILEIGANTKDFSKQYNLYYTTLIKVLNGECKTINGYKKL